MCSQCADIRGGTAPHPPIQTMLLDAAPVSTRAVIGDAERRSDQQDLSIARWRGFGRELKRRVEVPLPFDLALELSDLLREVDP